MNEVGITEQNGKKIPLRRNESCVPLRKIDQLYPWARWLNSLCKKYFKSILCTSNVTPFIMPRIMPLDGYKSFSRLHHLTRNGWRVTFEHDNLCHDIAYQVLYAVRSPYIMVLFLYIPHERHPIPRSKGRSMGCDSWVQIWPNFYHCNWCALDTFI